MSVLLWSTLLYLLGVAVLLLIRPHFMFRRDGSWKEFGMRLDEDSTPFPFWMFCVAWAVVSYFVIRLTFSQEEILATQGPLAAALAAATVAKKKNAVVNTIPEESEAEEDALLPLQAAQPKAPVPGYYKMKGGKKGAKNIPQYIYIGPEAPSDDE